MESALSPPAFFRSDLSNQSPSPTDSDGAWRTFVFVIFGCLSAVGVFWLAYTLFLKDCILVWKAKKQRKTEEIGFGTTPIRPNGEERR